MIKTVTITGADESIYPSDLLELSNEFPFVEWGILISKKQQGSTRFPSIKWIEALCQQTPLNLSVHICGKYVRDFFKHGSTSFLSDLGYTWNNFKRVQLNTHGEPHEFNTDSLRMMTYFIKANCSKQFIIQADGINEGVIKWLNNVDGNLTPLPNIAALFDLSHGAGLLPSKWPALLNGIQCGYAGGLSPDNLEDQIEKIESVVGDTEIWIDMETHIRSNNDQQFDLKKVRRCLEISSKYVKPITVY
jgi:hypothetical protein